MDNTETFSAIIQAFESVLPRAAAINFRNAIASGRTNDNPKDILGYGNWLKFKNSIFLVNVERVINNPIALVDISVTENPKTLYVKNEKVSFAEEHNGIAVCSIIQIYKIALMKQLTLLDVFKLGFHYGRWLHLSNTHLTQQ